MTRRVLVTGATGFVGRPAVAALTRRGFEVHGMGRQALDLLDPSAPAAMAGIMSRIAPTHLLHLAWCTAHGTVWDNPANDRWVDVTVSLAHAFHAAGGTRLVMAGSCAQYDWSDEALGAHGVASERATPRRPATRYGQAKEAAQDALGDGSAAFGLVFFPYGPHEPPARLVPSVTRALLAGEPAPISSGTQVRDFLHVTDCGNALAALVDSDVAGPVNIGSGAGTSVADVASAVAREVGREDLLRVGALPDRPGDPPRLVADVTRLRGEVGFEPGVDLEAGVTDAVEWWRQRMRRT